jgi:hypothetical protein
MSKAELRKIDDRTVEIIQGETRAVLTGPVAARIWWWYEHQLGHGQVYADTYLAGVIHGLQHASLDYGEQLLKRIRARAHR